MKKINVKKITFYFSYLLLLINSMCSNVYFIQPLLKYNQIIILVSLILIFLDNLKSFTFKRIFLILLVLLIMIISYKVTTFSDILFTGLFILSSKDIEPKEFIKTDFKFKLILFVSVIFFYFLGLAGNTIMYREDGMIRNSFGFTHPNHLGMYLFLLCCDLFVLYYKKFKIRHILFFVFSFLMCLFICDSRSGQICILGLIILVFFSSKIEKIKTINRIIPFLPIIFFFISLVCIHFYINKYGFIFPIDELLSNRIRRAGEFLQYYGVNIFGNYFELYGRWDIQYYLTTLDNAYLHILIHYGLLIFSLFIISFYSILKNELKKHNYEIVYLLSIILIYGFMERHIIELQYNCVLIYLGLYLYSKKKINN